MNLQSDVYHWLEPLPVKNKYGSIFYHMFICLHNKQMDITRLIAADDNEQLD